MAIIQANVARTAHDKDHVNTLAVPVIGVVEIRIVAGDQSSKSHRHPAYQTDRAPSDKGVDTFCFAPGPQLDETTWKPDASKTDKVKIIYDLFNPTNAITAATLELFSRYQDNPCWTRKLKDDELLDGAHELEFDKKKEWDGLVDAHANFPDQYVTVEKSPYKLKLTVDGKGLRKSPAAWTYFHVLVEKLELEYGPPEAIPASPADPWLADHRDTLARLKAQGAKPPASGGGPVKVYLRSNLFKVGDNEMTDNTGFTKYATRWDKGPEIPIFCKVWVRNSGGKPVVAPKALGKVKFLWDWESQSQAVANDFAAKAQDYYKDTTKPKGQNCHKDRGGKRGAGADPVFPAKAGYKPADALTDGAFPFKVEADTGNRKWAAYSYAWTDKKLASMTGVIFQPARMAGDRCSLSVYVAWDYDKAGKFKLDVDTDAPIDAPDNIKASTGTFEVWRRLDFIRFKRKRANCTPAVSVATVLGDYQSAFMRIDDSSGGASDISQADWNNRFNAHISGWGDGEKRFFLPGDQYAAPEGVLFRTRDQYITAWIQANVEADLSGTTLSAPGQQSIASAAANALPRTLAQAETAVKSQAQALGYSPPDQNTIWGWVRPKWEYVVNWMNNAANNYDTDLKYAKNCQTKSRPLLIDIFTPEFSPSPGIHLFQVSPEHNLVQAVPMPLTDVNDGEAFTTPGGYDYKCGFLLMAIPAWYGGPITVERVVSHEVGHHLFLPHTPDSGEKVDHHAHDKSVNNCIMSYNVRVEFCGFCQLRLRGWDKSKLNVVKSKNKKG